MEYLNDYYGKSAREREEKLARRSSDLKNIFRIVQEETGHDLSTYKLATVYRRINRRMTIVRARTIPAYERYLEDNPREEVETLGNEFMIRITGFYEQPEACESIKKQLKAAVSIQEGPGGPLAWTVGCATGEEAYTVAIMMHEVLEELGREVEYRVFATDIDDSSLRLASTGVYPASILAERLTPARLERFFTPNNSHLQVNKEIREKVLFSAREFTWVPPSFRMQLISARNTMKYLSRQSQQRLVPMFHGALDRGGLLFPGTKNSMEQYSDYFELSDKKWNIYRRR
jgi:two-component system CheB/CheR fusion protein